MDLRAGIMQSAGALGVSPLDLATAISYETAGTFDPRKAGPTTQWGQHRGLIQFGEPQAQKYGVNWEDPIGSQLGEGGAVVRYLKDTGVQPGMGLLDIYSAINAGGVGRFNASDANNGGAPGTVRDKVENQMADHRRKAAQMLDTPQSVAADTMTALGQPPRQENEQMNLLGLSTQGQAPQQKEPWWNADKRDRLVMGLEGMTLNPNQGLMAAAQAGMQERAQGRKEGAQEQQSTERRNRTAQWLAERGREDLAQAVAGGMIDAKTAVSEAMKPPAESYRQVTGTEARDMGLDPSKVYNVSGNGRVSGIGGGDTNVTVEGAKAQSAFEVETAKILAKEAGEVVTQGSMAQRNLGAVNRLGQLLESVPDGAQGSFINFAGQLGVKLDGSSEIEAANAIINQLIPQQRPPGSGTMSDADLNMFKQSLPALINTREGNRLIIETLKGIANYDVQMGQIARKMQLGEITPQQASQMYMELGNPLDGFKAPSGGGGDADGDIPTFNPATGAWE